MNGFRPTAWHTYGRTDARTHGRESLGLQRLRRETKGAKSIRTFDFSTLYTKIPHNLLKDAMKEIADFFFKGGLSHGVYITSKGVFWRKPAGDFRFYSNKPSRGVSWLPTVFLPGKLSKYRLKPPKDIVLGNPKKPDKTPNNGQNRFWVIKICF